MSRQRIHETNKKYWDQTADDWFGVTALPTLGVQFVTEEDVQLFEGFEGKRVLDIGCGSGHSLKYCADRGASDLWGLDMSVEQLNNAEAFLSKHGYTPKFVNAPMERDSGIPTNYFDVVYSIYAIGWTTDLDGTFKRISSYLKPGGLFIFSWKHPLHHCVNVEENQLIFQKDYHDESWFSLPIDGLEIQMCNRKISTYVNALFKAGFVIEEMVEETDSETRALTGAMSDRSRKAQRLPLSFAFKARKR